MQNELLAAIGITELPPNETEASLVKRVLSDNFFYNKVLSRLVDEWSVGVAEKLPFLEREALRNRIVPPAPKKHVVSWSVFSPEQTQNGRARVTATCAQETIHWTGTVADLRKWRFHGEAAPAEIVYLFEVYTAPTPDPLWVKHERERAKYALEQKRPKSDIEYLADEQIQINDGVQK
jgi:hypothetical protein